MKGNFGDMFDYSKELSDRRAKDHGGVDPVKEKYFKNYEKKTGSLHASTAQRSATTASMSYIDSGCERKEPNANNQNSKQLFLPARPALLGGLLHILLLRVCGCC